MKPETVLLKGKPVWKSTPSALRSYCEDNKIELKQGLKFNDIVAIVKQHLIDTGTDEGISDVRIDQDEKPKKQAKKEKKISKKDFILTNPATAEEKKIAEFGTMYAIKAWKLHKLGRTPQEIMAITGRWDKPSSTPRIIAEYVKNVKLRHRADAIIVS